MSELEDVAAIPTSPFNFYHKLNQAKRIKPRIYLIMVKKLKRQG